MIRNRALRTGDGSHECATEENVEKLPIQRDVEHFWGWDDELMTEEDKREVTIINRTD